MSAGLACSALLMQLGVAFLQVVDVEAALARLLQFVLRAEIGPGGVVELQVAAAGVVERLDRLLIGHRQIVEDGVAAGIGVLAHRIGLEPEMERRRRRDGHLRRHLGVRLQELEVLDHRMVGEADLAGDCGSSAAWSARPGTGCRGRVRRSRRCRACRRSRSATTSGGIRRRSQACSPISSCFLMILTISASSTLASSAALISPFSRLARASFTGAVRRMEPTWSARNGGLVRCGIVSSAISSGPWRTGS